uniref:Glutathione peroxidase n=1 Tax=Tetraselmis sp. GSL018 TaxID=582737 RepID=A0A061S1V9_9CHLO
MDKIEVNGKGADPLYKFLKERQRVSLPNSSGFSPPGEPGAIEWNYVKFVVDRNGQPAKRLKPSFDPMELERDVQSLLLGKGPLPEECILHPGRTACKVDYQPRAL